MPRDAPGSCQPLSPEVFFQFILYTLSTSPSLQSAHLFHSVSSIFLTLISLLIALYSAANLFYMVIPFDFLKSSILLSFLADVILPLELHNKF